MASTVLRPSTPPHHPNFEIHMSPENIKKLLHLALPEVTSVIIENLPPLKSYNNRIYFLKALCQPSDEQKEVALAKTLELVLKINGRDFGPNKIQNEVSCLRLLEDLCQGIPVPRVIAWSQDGSKLEIMRPERDPVQPLRAQPFESNTGGWLLMTRVPGVPIDLCKNDNNTLKSLAVQLADHVTNWRQKIPSQVHGGNLRFQEGDLKDVRPDLTLANGESEGANLVIRGILGDGLHSIGPIGTIKGYFKTRMENKLHTLATDETFATNRVLLRPIRKFAQEVLPTLRCLNMESDAFVFTHYDLSPRNVLISGKPPEITGIIDFEFSGFFPVLDEFLNDYIENNNDWPENVYEVYLKRLEENGIATPLRSIDKDYWKQMYLLEQLVQNIAPWYLPGEYRGKDLEAELGKAEALLREILEKLSRKKIIEEGAVESEALMTDHQNPSGKLGENT